MTWRYIAQRISGPIKGTFLDWNVPLSDVEITNSLGTNWLKGNIDPEFLMLPGPDGCPVLDKWSTALWAEEDGEIKGGGILVANTFAGPSRALEAMGYRGYPYGIPYGGEYSGVQVDPAALVKMVWDYVQAAGPSLDLNVIVTPTPIRLGTPATDVNFTTGAGEAVSFVAGPWKLNWYEASDCGSTLDTLSNDSPFETRESHYWNAAGNVIVHSLEYTYPAIGQRRTDLRFVLGENIVEVPGLTDDGMYFANEIWGLGSGTGRAMIRSISSVVDNRLRRVHVLTDNAEKSKDRMMKKAQNSLSQHSRTMSMSEIIVIDHINAPINSWIPGDEILVQADTGWETVELWCKILESRINPRLSNQATLTLEGLT